MNIWILISILSLFIISPTLVSAGLIKFDSWKRNRLRRKFEKLTQSVLKSPRMLSEEEFHTVSGYYWSEDVNKFFILHLTYKGWMQYNKATTWSLSWRKDWENYVKVWNLINTPLFKALNENTEV